VRGAFTGERLHEADPLFALDLARHRAAYEAVRALAPRGRVLDLGAGSGHGSALLAAPLAPVTAVDRVPPDATSRATGARFVRGDVSRAPLRSGAFRIVVSFQVIEHLPDPSGYLAEIARLLHPDGAALLSTPNRLTSDGVNPYHVHEYVAEELAALLGRHFAEVEMLGVGVSERVRRHLEARSRRIRRIVRLDPLRLRERLPRSWIEWLFARFAVWVRRRGGLPVDLADVDWRDYPVGRVDPGCLDLLAVCRRPRT
jgi:SAM-dependent methyltransferase